LGEEDRVGTCKKRVASTFTKQRTGQELKPLRKRVRFAKAFHLPSRGNKFTSNYKDLTSGLQTKGEFTSFKELVRTCKRLQTSVKDSKDL
jgi:hypothetical protein